MNIPKCLDFNNYNKYPSDENPTTDDQIQDFLGNQNKLVQALTDQLWQPLTNLVAGQVIHSPNMPAGLLAVVTTAGQTGSAEPTWGIANSSVSDGGVIYIMKKQTGDYLPLAAGEENPLENELYIKSSTIEIDTVPSVDRNAGIVIVDKIGNLLNKVMYTKDTKGNKLGVLSVKESGNAERYAAIQYGFDANNKATFTLSRTPDTNDSSNEIATTKFVQVLLESNNQSNQNDGIYYKSSLSSISSLAGSFWFDSSSGVPTAELPNDITSADWIGIQLGAKNGSDKLQLISNGNSVFIRYDDNVLGAETWSKESWTQGSWSKILNAYDLAQQAYSNSQTAATTASVLPYATCSTATNTLAKVATVINGVPFSLVTGACCVVKASNALTSNWQSSTPTLNINSTGAYYFTQDKYYKPYGDTSSGTLFIFNGSRYYSVNNLYSNTYSDYSGDSG